MIKNKKLRFAVDTAMILFGTFLMGFAFNVFLVPNKISPSGFSGIASLISVLFETYCGFYIPTSILYLLMNLGLYAFAFKVLGKRFAVTSAIGIASYSLFIEIVKPALFISNDMILCTIYGGFIMGLGLGIALRGRGSTGGSDLLACIINAKKPEISLGTIVICIDFVVVVLTMIVYGIASSLYSLIAIWLMGKVADIVIAGVKSVRAYYIISTKSEEISKRILTGISRGVTGIPVSGMYTHVSQTMLMVLVTRNQVPILKDIVADCDLNAFMFSAPVTEAMGQGFIPIKKKKVFINKIFNKKRLSLNKSKKTGIFKFKNQSKLVLKKDKKNNIKKLIKKDKVVPANQKNPE